MNTVADIKARLQEIAAAATTAAEALDAGRVDFLPPELARVLGRLDAVAERLEAACGLLALGVDPQALCGPENTVAGRECAG
jgi:hypothetical protein